MGIWCWVIDCQKGVSSELGVGKLRMGFEHVGEGYVSIF